MYEYFMEFELSIQEADHAFESAYDVFGIKSMEAFYSFNTGAITESAECDAIILEEASKFIAAVKEFFKKIVDSCRKFIHDVSVKFATDMQARKVNARLKQIKAQLAKDRELSKEQIEGFDTEKYLNVYTQYINTSVAMYKKLYSKNYTNMDEYYDQLEKCQKELDKKYDELKLNDHEAFTIAMYLEKAISMTEKEINSMNSMIKAEEKEINEFFSQMENIANSLDNSEMIADVKKEATKMSNEFSHSVKKAIDSPISKLGKILGKLGKGKKDTEDTNDKE